MRTKRLGCSQVNPLSVAVRKFLVGDRVVKNTATWEVNEFDGWGRGEGVGVIVEPPFPLDPDDVDVRWPGGRCFEAVHGLLHAT